MDHRYYLFVLLLISAACVDSDKKKVRAEDVRFTTTDASELFFKNVRKSEYSTEDMAAAGMEIYRPEHVQGDSLLLSPALIVNWKNDNAFLMLEKAESLPDELIIVLAPGTDTADTLHFDGSQQLQHAQVAVSLYNALLDEKEIFLVLGQDMVPLFSRDESEKFRRIVVDFLRLVELR